MARRAIAPAAGQPPRLALDTAVSSEGYPRDLASVITTFVAGRLAFGGVAWYVKRRLIR